MTEAVPFEAMKLYYSILGRFYDKLKDKDFKVQPGTKGSSYTIDGSSKKWICYFSIGTKDNKILLRKDGDNSLKAENWEPLLDLNNLKELDEKLETAIDLTLKI